MIAAVDVHYFGSDSARAACVTFADWTDEKPLAEHVVGVTGVAPYEPGAFYKRELPPILEVLKRTAFDLLLIDGYVWLGPDRKGLGAHLHDAVKTPIIGVAKTAFHGAAAIEVLRGTSAKPLYVTAAGLDPAHAADKVRRMHGPHRIPTILDRVDRLCRTG